MSEEDKELERIRRKKLKELMRRRAASPPPVSEPIEVTDSNFREVIRSSPLVVIDCWAPWCAPCRMMAPVIDELAKEYAGKILFGKLNVDENPRTPVQFQIMGIPTLLVFKRGSLVDRIIGALPKRLLEQRLAKHLKT